jgi:hypothetical protein
MSTQYRVIIQPNGWATKRDLATYYFPARRPEVSVAALRRWILSDTHLRKALQGAGYRPYTRYFTPRQVNVFRHFLS